MITMDWNQSWHEEEEDEKYFVLDAFTEISKALWQVWLSDADFNLLRDEPLYESKKSLDNLVSAGMLRYGSKGQ